MTAVAPISPKPTPVRHYENAAEWLHALGDVPPERIVMDPPPGTATEQDLLRFVERDKRLVELIDGTLVEKPVGWLEAMIAQRLALELGNFVTPRRLGVIAGADGTLRMASGRVRLPDVTFVSREDLPEGKVPREPIPKLPPTLAIEVISVTNTKAEMRQKIREYFESGARLVWLVYPLTRTIAVYESLSDEPTRLLGVGDTLDAATVLPGFAFAITSDLFNESPF